MLIEFSPADFNIQVNRGFSFVTIEALLCQALNYSYHKHSNITISELNPSKEVH